MIEEIASYFITIIIGLIIGHYYTRPNKEFSNIKKDIKDKRREIDKIQLDLSNAINEYKKLRNKKK